MKNKKCAEKTKKTRRWAVVPMLLLLVFTFAVLALVLPKLLQKQPTVPQKHYQGVVELWNVESFEGGSGSRSSWITSRAAKFEQQHEGLFVHVTNLTVEQLQSKLDSGENFDLVCFSRGAGCLVQDLLQPYTGSVADIKENLLLSGQINNTVYALPLYCGSYCLFAREEQIPANGNLVSLALSQTHTRKVGKNTFVLQPLVCGFTQFNSPLSALAMSGGRGKANVSESVTQYAAYEAFVSNKTAVTLLGTQRDLYRLSKREEAGKMEKLIFAPLGGYTDLVQYLAVSANCSEKAQSCMDFLQFLTGADSQQSLTSVNMFSVLQQTFYTTERYVQCEQALASAYVPNVFGDQSTVEAQRKTAISTLEM